MTADIEKAEALVKLGELVREAQSYAELFGLVVDVRQAESKRTKKDWPKSQVVTAPTGGKARDSSRFKRKFSLRRAAIRVIENAGSQGATKQEIASTLEGEGHRFAMASLGSELWKLKKEREIRLDRQGADYRYYVNGKAPEEEIPL